MLRSNFVGPACRRWCGPAVIAALGLSSTALAAGDDVTPFTVDLPAVSGPIASTPTDFAFGAEGEGIMPPVPSGYVVEEFFISGTARLYEYTPTGIRVVSPCPPSATSGCTNIPYTTRFLIKRPRNLRDASGTVIVEPLNPSGGFDIAAVWDRGRDHFVHNGDIFVGWTSKSVIVNALRQWNPTRYAALDWPYLPFVPGGNSGVNDGITFDIAAQIGAFLKANTQPGHPLRGLRIKHVLEAGFSQDGSFTFTQADIFHALERMPGGGPIYDGYVPMGTNGPSNINFGLTPAGALGNADPRHQMQPREVPVIQIDTETEIAIGTLTPTGLAFRRADGDARNDRYRLWEVPGAAHVSNDLNDPIPTLQLDLAQLLKISPNDLPPNGCTHQQFVNGPTTGVPGVVDPDDFPFAFVQNAAFERLTEWLEHDRPPPHAAGIQVDLTATPRAIVRDALGNAMGGVRTPFVDSPLTTYVPTDTVAHTTALSNFCILDGYNIPFDATQRAALYRNHGDYVQRVATQSAELVRDGFWLLPDALQVVEKAARARVP